MPAASFLWPGFGENMRGTALDFRCAAADARPASKPARRDAPFEDLDWRGLKSCPRREYAELERNRRGSMEGRTRLPRRLFGKFGKRCPRRSRRAAAACHEKAGLNRFGFSVRQHSARAYCRAKAIAAAAANGARESNSSSRPPLRRDLADAESRALSTK